VGFYSDHVLPHVIDLSMRNRALWPYRQRVLAQAEGRVLEVGVGSGLNLPFYAASNAREIVGLEPSDRLRAIATRAAEHSKRPVTFIKSFAECMPLESQSVDTVVLTWTLCSIADASRALAEMRRVLKPSGQVLFVEHGLAPEESVRKWQNRLTPMWKRIGGGCHLNRPIQPLIQNAGFAIAQMQTGYMNGPKPMTFMYEGRATPILASNTT
jgi:ubiquinone/menaquinone biosynthesis C-methylase UbiE